LLSFPVGFIESHFVGIADLISQAPTIEGPGGGGMFGQGFFCVPHQISISTVSISITTSQKAFLGDGTNKD
jgi:hypothetical protein